MAKTKSQRLKEIHNKAIAEFNKIQAAQRDERKQCLEDRRFYSIAGAQWEGKLGLQFENKPKLEVNKILLSVIRIFNEYRNQRMTVDFVSKDGSENEKLASVCDGLYRADEQDSCAEEAYDNAFEEAVGGGIGAWRLRAAYEDEYDDENEYQRIRFEPIYDADSCVFFDLNAKRQDKSDAMHCYVIYSMTHDQFIDEWGKDKLSSVQKQVEDQEFDWNTPDFVYVAEYYKVEYKKERIHIYKTILDEEIKYSDSDFEMKPELEEELFISGSEKIGEKKRTKRKVHKYILSGAEVLEDCGYVAGTEIPIIPVYGKRWFVDGVERAMGHVRPAKDMQRLKNMQVSKAAEIASLSTVEKPIVAPEQIAGHQQMWTEDNIKNFPFLTLNPLTDQEGNTVSTGPAAYTKVPNVPPAMGLLLQLTDADIKEVLGNPEKGEEIVSNISGKAIELIQNRLDMQTYIYISNMAKAIKRSGEVWLSMAKDLFVESGRKMKVINKDLAADQIELNRPMQDDEQGSYIENDLSNAKFDISVEVGPSSSSKKAATVRSLTGMLQYAQDPETSTILTSMALMNMEGEGLSDTQKFFRKKLVSMGVLDPTDKEMEEMQQALANQQPDANTQYLQAAALNEQAKAQKAQADTVLTLAKAEESQAKTAEVYADMDREDREQFLKTVEKINEGNM